MALKPWFESFVIRASLATPVFVLHIGNERNLCINYTMSIPPVLPLRY
jgi:hypothetical protein